MRDAAHAPSVLAAPDQSPACPAVKTENDACPKKCCPGTPAVPAKSPLFFSRLRLCEYGKPASDGS